MRSTLIEALVDSLTSAFSYGYTFPAKLRVNILMEELADKKIEVYDPLKSAGRTPEGLLCKEG